VLTKNSSARSGTNFRVRSLPFGGALRQLRIRRANHREHRSRQWLLRIVREEAPANSRSGRNSLSLHAWPNLRLQFGQDVVAQIAALIRFPESGQYPPCYPVLFNRALREQRAVIEKQARLPEQGALFSQSFLTINRLLHFGRSIHIAAPFRNGVAKVNRIIKASRPSSIRCPQATAGI